jgi:hypothetical protein
MEDDNYSDSMTEGEITHREYIRNTAYITPDWKYIRSTADINKLCAITCLPIKIGD